MEFQAFSTWEEMMDAIDRGRREADRRVEPRQAAIQPGNFFARTTPYDFMIFGIVQECNDKFYKTEQGKNFRFCKCFSVACPEGELGDVHVSEIDMLITEETFLKYKEKGWHVEDGDLL